MRAQVAKLLGRNYHSLNAIEVSASRLRHNFRCLSSLNPDIRAAPVVKSNAYGHGLTHVAKILDKLNPPFLCVDSLFEAYDLLKAGIKTKILIMGFVHPQSLKTKKLPFSFAVSSKDQIAVLADHQPHAPIHLFVDTGMHREGLLLSELPSLLAYTIDKTPLAIEGLMSHFAIAGKPRDPRTKNQVKRFNQTRTLLAEKGIAPRWTHIAASSGMLNHKRLGEIGNVARVGLALYGINPGGQFYRLKPTLQLKTTVAQVKSVKQGESLGYDFTFTARRNIEIGILPIGYNDGVDRRLSNKGVVIIKGKQCPIIGRVSMNLTSVDVSAVKNPQVGQSVLVFSNTTEHNNSIAHAAATCNTIPYDLLVRLHTSIRRVVTDEA